MPEIHTNPLPPNRDNGRNQDNSVPPFQQGGTPLSRSYLYSARNVLVEHVFEPIAHGVVVGLGVSAVLGKTNKWVITCATNRVVQGLLDATMAPGDTTTFMEKFSKNTIGMATGEAVAYIATENMGLESTTPEEIMQKILQGALIGGMTAITIETLEKIIGTLYAWMNSAENTPTIRNRTQ